MEAIKLDDIRIARLRKFEDRISHSEHEGLRARWEFGKELLDWRVGKKLPVGVLDRVCTEIGVSRSELQYRIQFAEKYSDETLLSNGVRQWPTWHQMVQEGLVTCAECARDAALLGLWVERLEDETNRTKTERR